MHVRDKHSSLLEPLVSYKMTCEYASKHFILFVTYKWAQLTRVFVHGKPFQARVIEHFNLLGSIVNYKEKECY
jgi:hypothetical protein